MKENKRNIDEFFQQELGNATEAPPSLIWETLENKLDNKSDKPRKIWWFYSLLLVILFGGSIAAYQYVTNSKADLNNKIQNDSSFSKAEHADVMSNKETEGDNKNDQFLNEVKENETAEIENTIQSPEHKSNKQSNASESVANAADYGNNTKGALTAATNNVQTNITSGSHHAAIVKETNRSAAGASKITGMQSTDKKSGSALNNSSVSDPAIAPVKVHSAIRNTAKASGNLKDKKVIAKTASSGIRNTPNVASAKRSSKKANVVKGVNETQTSGFERKDVKDQILGSSKKSGNKSSNNRSDKDGVALAKTNKESTGQDAKGLTAAKDQNESEDGSDKNAVATSSDKKGKKNKASSDKKIANANTQKTTSGSGQSSETALAKVQPAETKSTSNNKSSNTSTTSGSATAAKQTQTASNTKAAGNNEITNNKVLATEPKKEDNNSGTAEDASGSGNDNAAAAKKAKVKRPLNFYIGAKAGYERGFDPYIAHKVIGNVFGEVKFSNRFSFIIQPGIRIAKTNKDFAKITGSYYKADSTTTTLVSVLSDSFGRPYQWNYRISQNYDSMIASSSAGRRYVEMELPFLFRYKLDKNFSVLAGMSFSFGKILGFNNSVKTISGLSLIDSAFVTKDSTTKPSIPAQFSHTGSTPFSSYTAGATDAVSSPMRFGYMLGFSYAFREKLMIDFMLQQNLSGTKNISDAEIRRLFTQPYVRLTLGYIIFGGGKK